MPICVHLRPIATTHSGLDFTVVGREYRGEAMSTTLETTHSPRSLSDLPLADPGVPDLRSGDRLLMWIARKQARPLTVAIVWGIAWMAAQAAVPAALGAGVQATANRQPNTVALWAAVVLVLGVAQAAAGIMRHRLVVVNWIVAASRIQQLVARRAGDLGADLARQVSTGEVVAVTASDVERIGSAFDVVARFVGAIVAFIGVGIVLVLSSPLLGVIVLVGMPLISLVILPLLRPLERRESAQREQAGIASAIAADTISGLRVLRGIGGEELFVARYRDASQHLRTAAVSTARVRSTLDALQVLIPGLFVVLITWLGANLALNGTLTVGQLVAFYGYTAFLVLPLLTVTEAADKWTRARVAARRVVAILALNRADGDGSTGGSRDADDLSNAAHTGVTLNDSRSGVVARPGGLTGIVCADPVTAGELADRLGGYGEREATVLVDGTPLTDYSLDQLRSVLLVQDKDPVIMSGSLADLLIVPGSSAESLPAAIWAAAADDVVDGLGGDPADVKHGFDSELPERGRTLSGGQRQRLSLARSLMANPDVLVLDEPTSAVDAHTEARIAERLGEHRSGRTTLVFTTSPLMLDRCDVVLFAPDGAVVSEGRHRELVHNDPSYRAVVIRGEA